MKSLGMISALQGPEDFDATIAKDLVFWNERLHNGEELLEARVRATDDPAGCRHRVSQGDSVGTQVIKNAKIALLGATIPILNPIRVAEEFAMLDTMSGGRVIAGMLRGSPNEYVTYNINPAESRRRFEEALQLIKMA